MEFFLSTTFLPDGTKLSEALDLCEANNIHLVEIGSNHAFEENYNYIGDYDFDFLVHNYFPIPKESFVVNIASLDENIYRRSIEHIKFAISYSEKIGAKLYTFHPGFLTDPKGPNISKKIYDFQWDSSLLSKTNFDLAREQMLKAMAEIVSYTKNRKTSIAIETEGSLYKKDHLLMQQPEEYEWLFKKFSPKELGVNLNIGHLNLANRAFKFPWKDFVDLIQDYVVAMELSHNNGVEDQHHPIDVEGWYWPLIHDVRFKAAYKILEFRNTDIHTILGNMKMFKEKAFAV